MEEKTVKRVWLGKSVTNYLNLCFYFEDGSKYWITHLNEYLNFKILNYLLVNDHGSLDAFVGKTIKVSDSENGVIEFDTIEPLFEKPEHIVVNVRDLKRKFFEEYIKMVNAVDELEKLQNSWCPSSKQ